MKSKIKKLFIIYEKTPFVIVLAILLECKTERRNSQCKHGQPMEKTRGLICTCDSGVVRCQSRQQCHFWRMNLYSKRISQASELGSYQSQLMYVIREAKNGFKNLKIH